MRRKFMTLIFAVIFIFASCPVFADNLPAQFDLRLCHRSPLRGNHQKGTETCWAFASIASLESTYMTKFNAEDPDLSEMFVAYFVYGDPREGKSFPNTHKISKLLNIGGIANFAEAFMSKAGIVKDSVLPFNISQTPDKLPEEYESSGIRLSETCNFGKYYVTDDLEPCLKELIFNYGAVYVAYYTNSSGYSTFTDSDNYQAKAYYHNGYITSGHAVAVIGWDDNFSRENFQESMRPSQNGAWLISNSNPDNGGGYFFWMSYEQKMHDAYLFIADKSPEKLKHYGYDELGVSDFSTYKVGDTKSAANIFMPESDETLKYAGFYTVGFDSNYTVEVYDLGKTLPASPVKGSLIASINGSKHYPGYITEEFKDNVPLLKDHYFSVVVSVNSDSSLGLQRNGTPVIPVNAYYVNAKSEWQKVSADNSENKAACIKAFTVPGITASELALTGTLKENYQASESYSASLKASGGIKPFKWKVNNNLPEGVNYRITGDSDSEIKFSGAPAKSGTHTVNITLEDRIGVKVSKSFTLKVNALDINLSGSFANSLVRGNAYNSSITLNGGKAPYEWQLSGSLPKGLKLSYDGNKAALSGTPNSSGNYNFALKASDSTGGEVSRNFTIRVYDKLALNGSFASSLVKGADYSQTLAITGEYSDSFKFSKTGTVPPGLSLVMSGRKITLSGRASQSGNYNFAVNITDSSGISITKAFTIKITEMTLSGTLNDGVMSKSYSCKLTASGGTLPYKWTYSGTLPNGLKLTSSGANASLSGTPSKAGKFTFKITAYDKNNASVTRAYTVNITSQPSFNGTFTSIGSTSKKYSSTVKITGGTSPYKFKASGNLPKGLKLTYSGANIKLSGKPDKSGTSKFTLQVTDKNNNVVKKSFSVKIFDLKITGTLKAGTVNKSYTGTISVKGGTAPYTCKKSGNLPKGLKLTFSGKKAKLSGKPTKKGKYSFTLKFTDKNKFTVSKKFAVQINEAKTTAKASIKQSALKAANTVKNAKISESSRITANTAVIAAPYVNNNLQIVQIVHSVQAEKINLEVVNKDSIISRGTERDEDLITVKAGEPLTFEVTGLRVHNAEIIVLYDFKEYDDISVNDENEFTLPAELVKGDFVVSVRAESDNYEAESHELYFEAEE